MCLVVMTYLIVGKFERSQLTPQQVRLYVNEVNNKRKDLLQKYIQMSNEAKVLELDQKPYAKINLTLHFLLSLPICLRDFSSPPR